MKRSGNDAVNRAAIIPMASVSLSLPSLRRREGLLKLQTKALESASEISEWPESSAIKSIYLEAPLPTKALAGKGNRSALKFIDARRDCSSQLFCWFHLKIALHYFRKSFA